ncbi:MAG TPA: CHASE2 domain-containing protein [Acidobacteriota bacterium]|nr:CHASE2 domain-containing protein [Acidobacteriota bacterium]
MIVVGVMVGAASHFGLLGLVGWDQLLEVSFLDYVIRYDRVPFEGFQIVYLDEGKHGAARTGQADASLRSSHAALLRALTEAGAKVVAFDFYFASQEEEFDQDFAQAIAAAQAASPPVSVVVGTRQAVPKARRPTGSGILNSQLGENSWGLLDVGNETSGRMGTLWRVRLAVDESRHSLLRQAELTPSLALQIFMRLRFPGKDWSCHTTATGLAIHVEDQEKVLHLPTDRNLAVIVRLPEMLAIERVNVDYDRLLEEWNQGRSLQTFRDQVVIVGMRSDLDRYRLSDSRTIDYQRSDIYGFEIQAAAVSTLLHGAYLTPLPFVWQFPLLIFMAALGVALRSRKSAGKGSRIQLKRLLGNLPLVPPIINESELPFLLVAVIAVYLFLLLMVARVAGIFTDLPYDISAFVLGYWAARRSLMKNAEATPSVRQESTPEEKRKNDE